jgi:hypothetical protein
MVHTPFEKGHNRTNLLLTIPFRSRWKKKYVSEFMKRLRAVPNQIPSLESGVQLLGKIPNVTDTQGVRIFQTDRAPTGAEGPAPRVERRLGTGMGFAARRPPGQQCAAGIGTRTGTHLPCPGSPTACLPAAAAQWCLHRRSAGRASEIVMQPTSRASVRREPARTRRLVLM